MSKQPIQRTMQIKDLLSEKGIEKLRAEVTRRLEKERCPENEIRIIVENIHRMTVERLVSDKIVPISFINRLPKRK